MNTKLSDIRYLYHEYPDFVAACERATQEAHTAIKALTEQQSTMVSAAVQSHHSEGTPLPNLDELSRQRDEIWTKRNQRIEQAYKDHGVPLLQDWKEALEETGKATYYEVDPQPGRSRIVTLTRIEDKLTLEIRLTHVFLNGQDGLDEIENRLLGYYLNKQAWEAAKPLPDPRVRIVARAMADAKYDLASSTDPNAQGLAEAEYRRLIEDYSRNGENSEVALFIKNRDKPLQRQQIS